MPAWPNRNQALTAHVVDELPKRWRSKPRVRELIGFRRLTENDLLLMERWLGADHIVPWWGPAPTRQQVAAHYLPYIRHEQPTDPYLIMVDGTPVGYIQTFRIADWPSYWPPGKPYESEQEATGIDLLIGDEKMTGRDLGTHVIQEFLREIVFTRPHVPACYADPAAGNLASLGAFRKAGFVDIGPLDAPGDPTPRRLLWLARDARNTGMKPMELGYGGTELRRKLVAAVLRRNKVATASLREDYYPNTDEPLPRPGDCLVLIGYDDEPLGIVKTTDVRIVRAGDVDLQFARDEGENYETVEQWRSAHERFWAGREVTDDTLVVCERFALVDRW